jgi:hypothetical protein
MEEKVSRFQVLPSPPAAACFAISTTNSIDIGALDEVTGIYRRDEMASLVGLCGTRFHSGSKCGWRGLGSSHELGIFNESSPTQLAPKQHRHTEETKPHLERGY